jgi:hypothetical protein
MTLCPGFCGTLLAVPEPSAALLFAIGSTTIALRVRRRTR